MKISRLRVNRMKNPLGFQMESARISYIIEDVKDNTLVATEVFVAYDPEFLHIVYQSAVDPLNESVCYKLPIKLEECTRYYWRVVAKTNDNETAESEIAWFETAKDIGAPWYGYFITQTFEQTIHPVFLYNFTINKEVQKSRIYILGLGLYELYVNGKKVSEEYLLPGTHAYDSWLQYQTFELELKQGENRIEVMLGDGWYKGAFGLKSKEPRYGDEYALIADFHICYTDGTEEKHGTNESWRVKKGKVQYDSIYDGEIYDATKEEVCTYLVRKAVIDTARLQPRLSPRIIMYEKLKPVSIINTPAREKVLDMGQNMVGWMEFKIKAPYGTKITLYYGEILQNGNFYRENMRKAKCEYTYISNGKEEIARAHFTFYGFRYVKIVGWSGEINPDDFTGCVIHSELEEIGYIKTDNALLNQLISNIKWGQKGNFLDTPTDCPQRDERMGWTGDAQIFADTACFQMDTYSFFYKYGRDLAYEQKRLGGSVPYVVPMSRYELGGVAAWGDAATIIPWFTYLHFGDSEILSSQYKSMKAWVDYIKAIDDSSGGKGLWITGRQLGDWLALDGKVKGGVFGGTDIFYIASAYYYFSTLILHKTAVLLHYNEDTIYYGELLKKIKEAFQSEYFTATGRLSIQTQTAYAIAIYMDLVPENAKERIKNDFKNKLKENNNRLNTGFVGTPYLCQALSEFGLNDIAYELMLSEEYPGWLYEVKQGATTVWERWDSVLPDGSICESGMNSLNHYSYGSIEAWMYRYMVGIKPLEEAPGYKKAKVFPMPNYRLKDVNASLLTPSGEWKVGWHLENELLTIRITVPYGATAYVTLPDATGTKMSGNIPSEMFTKKENHLMCELMMGEYIVTYTPNRPYRKIYGLESNLKDLLNYDKSRKILETYFPKVITGIAWQKELSTLEEVIRSPFSEIKEENIKMLKSKLECL